MYRVYQELGTYTTYLQKILIHRVVMNIYNIINHKKKYPDSLKYNAFNYSDIIVKFIFMNEGT